MVSHLVSILVKRPSTLDVLFSSSLSSERLTLCSAYSTRKLLNSVLSPSICPSSFVMPAENSFCKSVLSELRLLVRTQIPVIAPAMMVIVTAMGMYVSEFAEGI